MTKFDASVKVAALMVVVFIIACGFGAMYALYLVAGKEGLLGFFLALLAATTIVRANK